MSYSDVSTVDAVRGVCARKRLHDTSSHMIVACIVVQYSVDSSRSISRLDASGEKHENIYSLNKKM